MKFDFDKVVTPPNTGIVKWDLVEKEYGEKDLIPLWIAEMDFQAPQPVIDSIKQRAEQGLFGYSLTTDAYYQAIIEWMKRKHQWTIKKEWICHAPGVVYALHYCVQAFTRPGDKIVIQTPVYPPFKDVVERNGRELLCNPLKLENGRYVMDVEDLERKMKSGVRMIILCSPHNPVGRVWTREELKELGDLALEYDVLVAADEIHADLVYPPLKHTPFSAVSERYLMNSIICTSPSKAFNLAGLQSANIIIPNPNLRMAFNQTRRRSSPGSANTFALSATISVYQKGEEWLEQCLDYLKGNRDFLWQYINRELPELKVIEPEGTYLVWVNCRGLKLDSKELQRFLVEEAKVAVSYGDTYVLGGNGFIRINIASPRSVLTEGLERIRKAIVLRRKL